MLFAEGNEVHQVMSVVNINYNFCGILSTSSLFKYEAIFLCLIFGCWKYVV